jgi:hypothetical protein
MHLRPNFPTDCKRSQFQFNLFLIPGRSSLVAKLDSIRGLALHFEPAIYLQGPTRMRSVSHHQSSGQPYAPILDLRITHHGAILSADTLAGEIASGTVQALAAKPVRRVEIVLGKWLGFAGLLGLYLLLMARSVVAISYGLTGFSLPNLIIGIGLIYFDALLVMTVTLACSSRLSTLATGGVVFGLHGIAFIGGWVEQFGAFLQNQRAGNVGIISSLIIPSEALWRRAAFEMTHPGPGARVCQRRSLHHDLGPQPSHGRLRRVIHGGGRGVDSAPVQPQGPVRDKVVA